MLQQWDLWLWLLPSHFKRIVEVNDLENGSALSLYLNRVSETQVNVEDTESLQLNNPFEKASDPI